MALAFMVNSSFSSTGSTMGEVIDSYQGNNVTFGKREVIKSDSPQVRWVNAVLLGKVKNMRGNEGLG